MIPRMSSIPPVHPPAVWYSAGHPAAGGVLLDDPPVLHVLGELGLQHQAPDLRWAG